MKVAVEADLKAAEKIEAAIEGRVAELENAMARSPTEYDPNPRNLVDWCL